MSSLQQSTEQPFSMQQFPHFMLKEIYDQPGALRSCLKAYLQQAGMERANHLDASPICLNLPKSLYANLEQIHILACGTSRHASLVGQFWFEQLAGLPTQVRSAAEFPLAPLPLTAQTLTIAVTQSGETTDTLTAARLEQARRAGQPTPFHSHLLGITNDPESALTKQVDYTLLTLAGTETGVAATKTFTAQILVFYCLALDLAYHRQVISAEFFQQKLRALHQLPDLIEQLLEREVATIAQVAAQFTDMRHCILLGQGINWAIALEGALKLKETTYIHAEGYAAGEFMHGPVALLDAHIPVIAIAPNEMAYQTILPIVQKARTHNSPVIGLIAASQSSEASTLFDQHITLPEVDEWLSPFLAVIPLQLLAYYIAVQRGLDVDQPRHITKVLNT